MIIMEMESASLVTRTTFLLMTLQMIPRMEPHVCHAQLIVPPVVEYRMAIVPPAQLVWLTKDCTCHQELAQHVELEPSLALTRESSAAAKKSTVRMEPHASSAQLSASSALWILATM